MSRRFFLTCVILLLLALAFDASVGKAQSGSCCDASWKLPLPAGEWLITQGDKDSCVSSHCAPTWVVNEYALDIVSASEAKIKTLGAPVLAPADGTVIDEFWDGYGGGKVLKIEHGKGGPVTVYMHLDGYSVSKGAVVKQGEQVAKIGATGVGTGPHLHVIVLKNAAGAKVGLKIFSWDGNANFSTGSKIYSTNGTDPTFVTKVPSSPPNAPSLSKPENFSFLPSDKEVVLVWNSSANASQYKVELWGGAYDSMTPCDWQNGLSCRVGKMWPGTVFWHVKARNSAGQESEWSDSWSFTIQEPTQTPPPSPAWTSTQLPPQTLQPPSLREPSNGVVVPPSEDIWFAWNYVPNADQYYLEYWGGPYEKLNSGWMSDVAYHVGTMWPGSYSWRVKARGKNGVESAWSRTWTFVVEQQPDTPVPTNPAPSAMASPMPATPTAVPSTATPVPQPGFLVLLDPLKLYTESGAWPPQSGQKIIAHIKVQNGGDLPLHITHIGVRGRRNGSEFWDIGFWTIDLAGHETWSLDPNNERPLLPGDYSFRISYSLDGSAWMEIGNEINFTAP